MLITSLKIGSRSNGIGARIPTLKSISFATSVVRVQFPISAYAKEMLDSFLRIIRINSPRKTKEHQERFTERAFRKLLSMYVFSYFPFGFEGRIWGIIVSVPDHCLTFYFFMCSLSFTSWKQLHVELTSSNPYLYSK